MSAPINGVLEQNQKLEHIAMNTKILSAAIVALSLGLTASLPASAAFGPKDVPSFDGPGFGPSDVRTFDGPGFGPKDVTSFDGPGYGPADIRSFEGPANGDTLADRK